MNAKQAKKLRQLVKHLSQQDPKVNTKQLYKQFKKNA